MKFQTDTERALIETQAALKASVARENELRRDLTGTVNTLDALRRVCDALFAQNAFMKSRLKVLTAEMEDMMRAAYREETMQ